MKSFLLALVALLTFAAVNAETILDGKTPVTDPDVLAQIARFRPPSTSEWHRFGTLHAAAMYGATRLEQCSHYYECSLIIVVDPKGEFAVGPSHTDYNSDNVRIILGSGPSDWPVAADMHSHPCVPHHAGYVFSPQDTMGSLGTRTTSYMIDQCTGDVHEFIPGVTKPDEVLVDGMWMTPGVIIGRVSAFADAPLANEGI